MSAGTVPFTDEQNQHSEERSRLLLMTSVDKRDARVRLDAAMQAVINKSASDVIKVRMRRHRPLRFDAAYKAILDNFLLPPRLDSPSLSTTSCGPFTLSGLHPHGSFDAFLEEQFFYDGADGGEGQCCQSITDQLFSWSASTRR